MVDFIEDIKESLMSGVLREKVDDIVSISNSRLDYEIRVLISELYSQAENHSAINGINSGDSKKKEQAETIQSLADKINLKADISKSSDGYIVTLELEIDGIDLNELDDNVKDCLNTALNNVELKTDFE